MIVAAPIPEAMPFEEAAGLLLTYATTHHALYDRGRLASGERVLVLGGAGGIGVAGIQLAKARGCSVIAVASTEAKRAFCLAQGADAVLDPGAGDPKQVFKGAGRLDVVLDPVGGEQTEAALRALSPRGRLLVVGFASGTVPQIPANHLLVKNLTVIGLYWGGYLKLCPRVLADSLATLFAWYGEGRLRPHVSREMPLERAAEALELLRSRQSTGKVVVTL